MKKYTVELTFNVEYRGNAPRSLDPKEFSELRSFLEKNKISNLDIRDDNGFLHAAFRFRGCERTFLEGILNMKDISFRKIIMNLMN